MYKNLSNTLNEIEEDYGGDITFIPKASIEVTENAEKELGIKLPKVLKYFYSKETNGLIIDNKRIYSLYDKENKKTFSDNLQRANNPKTSFWFKYKPEIFKEEFSKNVDILFDTSIDEIDYTNNQFDLTLINKDNNKTKDKDIHVCFRNKDGSWTKPINLGKEVNSNFSETSPRITPDGKYLFFSRYIEDAASDIYWVSTEVIENLRPK